MDGSYGHPARHAQYPMSSQTQSTNNYQVNVKRNKTRKWVEAKTHSYDGDDWGADEFADDFDEDESQPQPVAPTPQQSQPLPSPPPQQQQQQQQEYPQYQLPFERAQPPPGLPSSRSTPSPTSRLSDLPSLRTHTRQSPSLRGFSPAASDPTSQRVPEQAARKSPLSSTSGSLRHHNTAESNGQPSPVHLQTAVEQATLRTSDEGVRLIEDDKGSEHRSSSDRDRRDSWERSDDSHHSRRSSRSQSQDLRSTLQTENPADVDRKISASPRPFGHKATFSLPMGGPPPSEHRRSPTLVLQTYGSQSFQVPLVDADEDDPALAPGGASLTSFSNEPDALSPRGFPAIAPLRTPSPHEPRSLTPILLSTNPNFTPPGHLRRSDSPAEFEPRLYHRDTASSTGGSSPVKESDRLSYEILKTLRPRGATMGGVSLIDDPRQPAPASEHISSHERSYSLGIDGQWDRNAADPRSRRSPSPSKSSLNESICVGPGGLNGSPPKLLRKRFSWEAHNGDEDQGSAPGQGQGPAASGEVESQQRAAASPTAASDVRTMDYREIHGPSSSVKQAESPGHDLSPATDARSTDTARLPAAAERHGKRDSLAAGQALEILDPSPLPAESTACHSPIAVLSPTGQFVTAKIMSFKDILALGSTKERIAKFNETRRLLALQESGLDSWLSSLTNRQSDPGTNVPAAPQGSNVQTNQAENAGLSSVSQTSSQQPYFGQFPAGGPNPASAGRTRLGGLSIPAQMSGSAFSHSSAQIGTKGKEFMQSAGKMGKGLLSKGKSKLRGSGDKGELSLQQLGPKIGERRSPWRLSFNGLDPKPRDGVIMLDTQTTQGIVAPSPASPPYLPAQSPVSPFDTESETGAAVPWAVPRRMPDEPDLSHLVSKQHPVAKAHAHNLPAANQSLQNDSGARTRDAAELGKPELHGGNAVSPPPSRGQIRIVESPLPAPGQPASAQPVIPAADVPRRVSSFIGLPPIRVGSALNLGSQIEIVKELLEAESQAMPAASDGPAAKTPLTPGFGSQTLGGLEAVRPHDENGLQAASTVLPSPRSMLQPSAPESMWPHPSPTRSPARSWKLRESRLLEPLHTLSRKRSGADLIQQAMADSDSRDLGHKSPNRVTPLVPPAKSMPLRQRSDAPPLSSQRYPGLFAPRKRPGARDDEQQKGQLNRGQDTGAGESPNDAPEERSRGRSAKVLREIGSRIIRATSRERQRSSSRTRPANAFDTDGEATESEGMPGEYGDAQENGKKRRIFQTLGGVRPSMDRSSSRPPFNPKSTTRSSSAGPREDEYKQGGSTPNLLTRSMTAGPFGVAADGAAKEVKEPKRKGSGFAGFFGRSRQERNGENAHEIHGDGPDRPRARPRSNTTESFFPVQRDATHAQGTRSRIATNPLFHRSAPKAQGSRATSVDIQRPREQYLLPHPQFGPPIAIPYHKHQASKESTAPPSSEMYGQRTAFAHSQPLLSMGHGNGPESHRTPGNGHPSEAGRRADQIETDIEDDFDALEPLSPWNRVPAIEVEVLQPSEGSGDVAKEDPRNGLPLTPGISVLSEGSFDDREGLSVSQISLEGSEADDAGPSVLVQTKPISGSAGFGGSSSPRALSTPLPRNEPLAHRVWPAESIMSPPSAANTPLAHSVMSRVSSLRLRTSPVPMDRARELLSREKYDGQGFAFGAENQSLIGGTAPEQQTYQVSIVAAPPSPQNARFESRAHAPPPEAKSPASRWRELRSRVTDLAISQYEQGRSAKASRLVGQSSLVGTLRRTRKQAEPLSTQFTHDSYSSGQGTPRSENGRLGERLPGVHSEVAISSSSRAIARSTEPQYDPVPIPEGYPRAYGEGTRTDRSYQTQASAHAGNEHHHPPYATAQKGRNGSRMSVMTGDSADWQSRRHEDETDRSASRFARRAGPVTPASPSAGRSGAADGMSTVSSEPRNLVQEASVSNFGLDLLKLWDERMEGSDGLRKASPRSRDRRREPAARAGTSESDKGTKMSASSYPGQEWDPWRLFGHAHLREH